MPTPQGPTKTNFVLGTTEKVQTSAELDAQIHKAADALGISDDEIKAEISGALGESDSEDEFVNNIEAPLKGLMDINGNPIEEEGHLSPFRNVVMTNSAGQATTDNIETNGEFQIVNHQTIDANGNPSTRLTYTYFGKLTPEGEIPLDAQSRIYDSLRENGLLDSESEFVNNAQTLYYSHVSSVPFKGDVVTPQRLPMSQMPSGRFI